MYIELAKGKYEVIREVSEVVIIDEDKNGKILEIEIVDTSKDIPSFDSGNISLQTA